MNRDEAKKALDKIIRKARIHFYKPIQIAEILYQKRLNPSMDLSNLESYRSASKAWRDTVSIELLKRICTSSSKFQDDIFNNDAVPPEAIVVLGEENNRTNGAVEAYIYRRFETKHNQLSKALDYCKTANKETFYVGDLINSFWHEPGLRRSLDKIYEIIVHSLFTTLIDALELTVEISMNPAKTDILLEFEDFTTSIMCINFTNSTYKQAAKVYRVGVTNAADRGLDMYSNWGPAIQIKHLALDETLAENIVETVSSDKIIIVCKSAEEKIIVSLLTQIGWKAKIQSIVTEDKLKEWYEKALRGRYAKIMGDSLLSSLSVGIAEEFPSIEDSTNILTPRHYEKIHDDFWQ